MEILGFLTLFFCFINIAKLSDAQIEPRIVGGQAINIQRIPYMVQIFVSSNTFHCGGTLISPVYVVTAAHCTTYRATQMTVKAGATTLSGSGAQSRVRAIARPSNYNARTYHNDIAMLLLNRALQGSDIGYIPVCARAIPNGATVRSSGWGSRSEGGSSSNQLRTVQMRKISMRRCRNSLGTSSVTGNMVCAIGARGQDTCMGDSGGPLVYNNQLCGVVSWGYGCARPNVPGVYTNVLRLRQFVNRARTRMNRRFNV